MFVNRKKIRVGSFTGSSININISMQTNINPLDNEDVVKSTFVKKEVEKSINEIFDHKKVRFKPAIVKNNKWKVVSEVKYILNFIDDDDEYSNFYDVLGFNSENLFCRVNKLIKSYLTLDYYDSNNSTQNNFLTGSNIYTQMGSDQLRNTTGVPKKSNECPISYRLGSPTLRPDMVHEGFHIYWYASDVLNSDNNEYVMYLSPTYQNANNGKVSIMSPYKGEIIPALVEDLQYTKVILKYYNGLFLYTIAPNNITQMKDNGGGIDWNNNSSGVPTITFYESIPNNIGIKIPDIDREASKEEKELAGQERERERKLSEEEIEEETTNDESAIELVDVGFTDEQESATGEVGDGVGATGSGVV